MKLSRVMMSAALSILGFGTGTSAQEVSARHMDLQPFLTLAIGPSSLESRRFHGGAHPAVDLTAGARKQFTGALGFVFSANAGQTLKTVLGGEDAVCRIRTDGQPGCYPLTPVVRWFGVSVGGEAYLGRAIMGLQTGPAAFSVPKYERALVSVQTPSREFGVRTQFDVQLPIYRQVGMTFSAVNRFIPHVLDDRWQLNSLSAGVTLREFHAKGGR